MRRCVLFVLLSLSACTTTQALTVKELRTISAGAKRDAVVLNATDGTSVRIDPSTSIRFTSANGTQTPWYQARELQVGERGVIVERDRDIHRIAWDEIQTIDAKNLSGSKSLALVVGSAAVVAAIAAMFSTKSGPRIAAVTAYTGARVGVTAAYVVACNDYRCHHHVHVEHCDHPHHRHDGTQPHADPAIAARAPKTIEHPSLADTSRLFEGPVRRRSSVEIVPAFAGYARIGAGNLSFGDPLRYAQTISVSARIAQMAELGFGIEHRQTVLQISENERARESQLLGFLRGGASFYLDDEHRVAVPLLLDLGFGSNIGLQARFAFGFRVRIFDSFMLGLYPVIPTYTSYRDPLRYGESRWTMPSAIETSFAF